MTQAYRYHRFSSKAQDKGSSLERQDEATRTMCEQHGWTIVETLEDKGRSAWKGDHLRVGELGRFKQRVDAGEIPAGSILVVENFDRLSRQEVKKARRWIEEVTEAGVKPKRLLPCVAQPRTVRLPASPPFTLVVSPKPSVGLLGGYVSEQAPTDGPAKENLKQLRSRLGWGVIIATAVDRTLRVSLSDGESSGLNILIFIVLAASTYGLARASGKDLPWLWFYGGSSAVLVAMLSLRFM